MRELTEFEVSAIIGYHRMGANIFEIATLIGGISPEYASWTINNYKQKYK